MKIDLKKEKFTIILICLIVVFVVFVVLRNNTITRNSEGLILGDENATITVTVFSSFNDYDCKVFAESGKMQEILDAYNGTVKFMFRHYPDSEVAGLAAEAVMCAHDQNLFWEMHDSLFKNQGSLNADILKFYSIQSLNKNKYRDCMEIRKYKRDVEVDKGKGMKLKIKTLPTFFVNEKRIEGNQLIEVFKTAINEELNKT